MSLEYCPECGRAHEQTSATQCPYVTRMFPGVHVYPSGQVGEGQITFTRPSLNYVWIESDALADLRARNRALEELALKVEELLKYIDTNDLTDDVVKALRRVRAS